MKRPEIMAAGNAEKKNLLKAFLSVKIQEPADTTDMPCLCYFNGHLPSLGMANTFNSYGTTTNKFDA
jgi:hypothetical protein